MRNMRLILPAQQGSWAVGGAALSAAAAAVVAAAALAAATQAHRGAAGFSSVRLSTQIEGSASVPPHHSEELAAPTAPPWQAVSSLL